VSRRTKGSKRRRKAVQLLKRHHQRVRRQRRDFHHKTARALQQYDVIYLEDLQVRNMVRNPYLAKSISDAGWAAFRTILTSKAAYAGTWVVAVPPAYTSQDCSGVLPDGSRCTQRVAKSLSVRTISVRPADWCSTAMRTRRSIFAGPGRPVRRQRGPLGRA
jgi:putative transposase